MDNLEASAPSLYMLIVMIITILSTLVVGVLLCVIVKILDYEPAWWTRMRTRTRTRIGSDEQEVPMATA